MSLAGPEVGGGLFRLKPSFVRDVLVVLVAFVLLSAESVLALHPLVRTDVATLVIVYLALEHELLGGLAVALAVGYVADVFSGESRGLYTGSLVSVFLILRLFVARIVGSRWFLVASIGVVAVGGALLIRLLIEGILGPNRAGLGGVAPALPSLFVSSALLGYPVYRVLRAIDARFSARDEFTFRVGR